MFTDGRTSPSRHGVLMKNLTRATADLCNEAGSVDLGAGLTEKLREALAAVQDGRVSDAMGLVQDFSRQIEALTPGGIPAHVSASLLEFAADVVSLLGRLC
jgi:hypothetical protein